MQSHASRYYLLSGVHSDITEAFLDIYYTENMFALDVRHYFRFHGRKRLDDIWTPWLSKLDDRHAGMIQHFRILTPAFSAVVHIPMDRDKDVAVVFRGYVRDSRTGIQVDKLVVDFKMKLGRFNVRVVGRRLTKADLDLLIKAVISTVPYCCRTAEQFKLFCLSRPESGELPEDCWCEECQHQAREPDKGVPRR